MPAVYSNNFGNQQLLTQKKFHSKSGFGKIINANQKVSKKQKKKLATNNTISPPILPEEASNVVMN